MSLFDKARAALGQAAAAVSRETEVLSLQAQLGNLDDEMERVLIEMGKRARELKRAGQLDDQQINLLVRRIEKIDTEMMDLRRQVTEVQHGTAPPPAAGAAPAPPPPPAAAPSAAAAGEAAGATKACPKCGETLKATARFCDKCGAKLD